MNISESDPRIRCYKRENYNIHFSSKALGWFIQFAIRAELRAISDATTTEIDDDPFALREITENRAQIEKLIRDKHVIDEPALSTLGLSLYCFPAIDDLFSNLKAQSPVRQATVGEVRRTLESATRQLDRVDDRWRAGFEELNGIETEDGIADALEELTFTHLKSVAELTSENLIDELLFVVDLNAPTSLVVEQFRELVEGIKNSKAPEAPDYKWIVYGLLPYIDLEAWSLRNPQHNLDVAIQCAMVFRDRDEYGAKELNRYTRRLAKECLNTTGELFLTLKEAAAREIAAAIAIARRLWHGSAPGGHRGLGALVPTHVPS